MQVRTRDQLVTMYLKRIGLIHRNAKQRLQDLHDQQRAMSETLIDAFADVIEQTEATNSLAQEEKDAALGKHVRQIISANGGAEKLKMDCQMLQAYHNNNYLPLLSPNYRHDRTMPFRLMTQLRVRSTTKSQTLIQALDFIKEHQNKQGSHVPSEISIDFAGPRWQTLTQEKVDGEVMFNKHHQLAKRVDKAQAEDSDLYFDSDGKPHLRQLARQPSPEKAEEVEAIMKAKMPEHYLLDILHHVHHWVRYTRHFGSPSGSDPKLSDPLSRYLLTIFGYGCNLGAAQTARHARSLVTERVIRRLNAQHITTDKLDTAIRQVGIFPTYYEFTPYSPDGH